MNVSEHPLSEPIRVWPVITGLLVSVFLLDLETHLGIAVHALYAIPICLCLWSKERWSALLVLTAVLILSGVDYLLTKGVSAWAEDPDILPNRLIVAATLIVLGFLVAHHRHLHLSYESLLKSRAETMERMKILAGLLPICACCKSIRDDAGYWKELEAFIGENSEANFSHSICPSCVRKLYPPEVADQVVGQLEKAKI